MIAGLIGKIYKKEVSKVLFNVNNVIYEVFMSINAISRIKDNDTILISQITREDGISLYGFLDSNEKQLFDNLIKINGIGPKVGIAICGAFESSNFINIINNNDFASLKKIPGVGEKMAKRIMIEMNGKLENIVSNNSLSKPKQEALLGLESLGFKNLDIIKIIENSKFSSASEIIKEVLQKIKK